jgi:signal transduction histidine kinase
MDVLEQRLIPENVQVLQQIEDNLPRSYADPRHIAQVINNLIANACQAMPAGGQLTLRARLVQHDAQEWIAIEIADNGVGIAPKNLPHLFEPLFTTKPKGIGLGLAVARKMVEFNGGKIEAHSQLGVGSTFTVYLPIQKVN